MDAEALFKSKEEEMDRGNKLERMRKEERVEAVFLENYR